MKILSILLTILGSLLIISLVSLENVSIAEWVIKIVAALYFTAWGISGMLKMNVFYILGYLLYIILMLIGIINIIYLSYNLIHNPNNDSPIYMDLLAILSIFPMFLFIHYLFKLYKRSAKIYIGGSSQSKKECNASNIERDIH